MDKTYEAPRWAQVAIWIFICFGLFFSSKLIAEEKPVTCKAYMYPRIVCEAHVGLDDEAYWTVSINGVRADYEKGVIVYLTLPDDVWGKIEVRVGTHTRAFYGRWSKGKVEFHK